MRKRLLIGLLVSFGVNLLFFAAIVWMALSNNVPLEKIIPVEFLKVEVQKPKPPPPPPPPKKKKEPEKIEPTKAPIKSEPDPDQTATIQTSPEIKSPPLPSIVNFTELDRPPRRLKFIKPKYPTIARRANKQGMVVVKFLITRSGSVANVQVLKSPGGLGFAEAAKKAVAGWRYETPMMHGQPVAAWCIVPIRFELE